MAWDIDLNKTNRLLHTPTLRWRLLLSYLTVMLAILSIFTVGVYQYTRRSLYQLLDQRLEILAQAASHNLLAIKSHYQKQQQIGLPNKLPYSKTKCYLDYDQDLDIPWEQLRQPDQGIEWFNAQKQLIGNAGTLVHDLLPKPGYYTGQRGKIRAVTLPAYSYTNGNPHLEGYIRASQVTAEVEAVLSLLRWGLGGGGIVVLGLTGVGGIWLTRQSLKPIEASFCQLQQFTADAAHELRSPLASLKTAIQVMQCYPDRLHPQDLKKINLMAHTTDHTIRLIEDLLLLARMDEAAIMEKQQWSILSLVEIIEDLLELFESLAEEKGIGLKSQLLKDATVQGDGIQISRLFRNLLENALEYTQSGGTVTITMEKVENKIIVAIEDTGIGIAQEELSLIFDRFWRADKARSRRHGGMGMGLSIVQMIVKRHHGNITVNSQLCVGSCFRVSLPIN